MRCCCRHKIGCVSGSHLLFHVTCVVKGGVEKCCVNAFCVTVCLCTSLYMWCLCDQQRAAVVHGTHMWFVCQRRCCVFLYTRDIWASGPLLLPSASFWVVSCAVPKNIPECLTVGTCCWGFRVCVWLFTGGLCLRPFILFSDYTCEWHCVLGYVVCDTG